MGLRAGKSAVQWLHLILCWHACTLQNEFCMVFKQASHLLPHHSPMSGRPMAPMSRLYTELPLPPMIT